MPELPEVETLKRQLETVIIGKKTKNIKVLRVKSFQGNPDSLINKEITSIARIGKMLIISFDTPFPKMLIHLKMTGQLIYQPIANGRTPATRVVGGHPTADWINELPSQHTRVIITFLDNSILFFNDMRVFGWMKLVESAEDFEKEKKGFLGLDPLLPTFSGTVLQKAVGESKRQIKIVLLEQDRVAGLGNIYVNDALYLAGIHPLTQATNVKAKSWDILAKAIQKVLFRGIELGGASQTNYVHITGLGGSYQDEFLIYKQDKRKCKKCGVTIEKIKLGGRGTYFCPCCQIKK